MQLSAALGFGACIFSRCAAVFTCSCDRHFVQCHLVSTFHQCFPSQDCESSASLLQAFEAAQVIDCIFFRCDDWLAHCSPQECLFSSAFVPNATDEKPHAHDKARPFHVVIDDGLSLDSLDELAAAPVTAALLLASGPADPHADDDIMYCYAFSRIASNHLSNHMQLSQDCLTLNPKPEFAWPQVQNQGYAWARSKDGVKPDSGLVSWQIRLNKTGAPNQEEFWVGVATVSAALRSPDLRQKEMWVFGNYEAHINGKVTKNYNFARGDLVTLELERHVQVDTAGQQRPAVNTLRIRVDGKQGMEIVGLPQFSVLFPVFYLSSRCSYTLVLADDEAESVARAARADSESDRISSASVSSCENPSAAAQTSVLAEAIPAAVDSDHSSADDTPRPVVDSSALGSSAAV